MNNNHNPNHNPAGPESDIDSANKRAALAGQWRTPPMPVYPTASGYNIPSGPPAPAAGGQVQQHHMEHMEHIEHRAPAPPPPPDVLAPSSNIPSTSEDYAKALQEAYRKGAEAAARMAQQQQQQIPTAASCPNFSTGPHASPMPPPPVVGGELAEDAAYSRQVHPTHSTSHPSISDPLASTSMPPPPPPPQGQQQQQIIHTLHHSQPSVHTAPAPTVHHHHHHGPPPSTQHHHAPPPQQQHHRHYSPPPPQNQQPSREYSSPTPQPLQSSATIIKQPQGRSLSMPDMSTYAAQAEDEKRQKRLARNRASARLRRLRKKNLVDAYETEVGILEKTLKQLKAHEWGQDDNHEALLEALGMERGQQAIPPEQRSAIIRDILNHQTQQVELLRQAQLEQECLAMLAAGDDNADDEMVRELQDLLQLSEAQKQDLRTSSRGLESEIEALETIAASLDAMKENDWLINDGVQAITDQFTSILHKNQLSKFLLWTDANVEAIDQLDHVQVQPLQGAPMFAFGVESTPGDDDDGR